jgi:hypothetical protein
MKTYKIKVNVEREYKAKDEYEAQEMFWEEVEGTPQQTMGTFFTDNLSVEEIKQGETEK